VTHSLREEPYPFLQVSQKYFSENRFEPKFVEKSGIAYITVLVPLSFMVF
jgi:hypothetical protein